MTEIEKKQKLFYNRAQHQLKEIQFSCREVVSLSQQIALFANDINNFQVNSKKIEFLKTEIKDKLKQFAGFVDQIYKILDRKIVVLTNQIHKQLRNKQINNLSKSQHSNNSLNKSNALEKETQKSTQKSNHNISNQHDRFFSDTLNPRITQLQLKIAQYQQREHILNSKLGDMKTKNQRLLEQFNRLSTASNKKINQLSFELQKQKDSFSSIDSKDLHKNKGSDKIIKPTLLFDPTTQLIHSGIHIKNRDNGYSQSQQEYQAFFDEEKSELKDQKSRPFTFGCMPKMRPKQQNSQVLSIPKMNTDVALDKHDKSRRFDLLLNRLRGTEQPDAKKPTPHETSRVNEDYQSVFSQNIVKRYQI